MQDVLSVNHLNVTHVHSVICLPAAIFISSHFLTFAKRLLNTWKLQMSSLQILAFLSGLAGLGVTIGATVSNEWRATSRASSVITATWVLQGLWNNCAGNAIGALHCRPHHTILQLQGKFASTVYVYICMFKRSCMTHQSVSSRQERKHVRYVNTISVYGKRLQNI